MMRPRVVFAGLVFLAFTAAAPLGLVRCSSGEPAPIVDLRADTNRNGTIDWDDPTEDDGEDALSAAHGAIFLANIDDDLQACPTTAANGALLSDVDLPKCNDAQDTVVNGDADALDLAPLGVRAWPAAPDGTVATLGVDAAAAPYVHLFIQRGGALVYFDHFADQISTDELRAGATLAIEGTDVVRDAAKWNGYATITLTVAPPTAATTGTTTDAVQMRLAPIVTRHHLAPEEQVYVTKFASDPGSTALRDTLYGAMDGTDAGAPPTNVTEIDGDESHGGQFVYDDQWAQDFFEVATMSMPAPGGQLHTIDVYLRSANVYYDDPNNPLRDAGKIVFAKFRGPDAAGVVAYDPKHDAAMDSLDSFGNLETVPPYSFGGKDYALGRLLRGSVPSFHPDAVFETMMESQAVQPPIYLDTSWLDIGHVDETVSFVKANTPRGWAVLINDPALARQMLQDQVDAGNGDTLMFEGLDWIDAGYNPYPAAIAIKDVLADANIMATSDAAAASIDGQLQILKQETGIDDSEIVRLPFLHEPVQGYSVAYQPGTVNGLYYAPDTFAAPDPHGPVIAGKDIFKTQMEAALSPLGIRVAWIEDWDLYHRLSGEVHCGTNSKRGLMPGEKWWESGY